MAIAHNIPFLRCWFIKGQSCHHIETSQLICRAKQLTGFYMITTLAFNDLMYFTQSFLLNVRLGGRKKWEENEFLNNVRYEVQRKSKVF